MKNVYIVRFEFMDCFTTARKAIETARKASGFKPYIKGNEELEKTITDYSTGHLIEVLNKEGFITLYDGVDIMEIAKRKVV